MESVIPSQYAKFPSAQNLAPLFKYTFFYKQSVYKQPVLRPIKNVATLEAQKSPVA